MASREGTTISSSPHYIIRPATAADAEPLLRIWNGIVASGDAVVYDEILNATRMQTYVESYTSVFAIERDGVVVGGYSMRPNHPGRGSHVCNATYSVDAAYRGEGIGRRLGEHSIEHARELGFRAMQFNAVVETNLAAVALWQSLEFKIIGIIPGGYRHISGNYVDLLIMFRSL